MKNSLIDIKIFICNKNQINNIEKNRKKKIKKILIFLLQINIFEELA